MSGKFGNQGEKWHNHAFGSFGLPLVFNGGEAEENLWVGNDTGALGHRCPDCATVVFPGIPDEEVWTCPACGVKVPMRFRNCWKCQCPAPTD